ncbi:uncharacterized protein PV07_07266 [Cladophialophora immunda]|uniref:BD-FAE-like domain-containing protein n=1 Tax=Cladophialophora immunda TaxID=569365 RepID=A0A0D1ZHW8_9EURO|nr:uncharacterized protein PV07_07266 [Cladophialophora immunda]KIW27536.1 hypothetical protein PV07_07266 [Cladophialophora immunda]
MLYCCCRRGLNTFFRPTQGHIAGLDFHRKRLLTSASTSKPWKHDSIELPVGVSGRVRLDIFSPYRRIAKQHGPRNLLVHLPPGPSIDTTDTASIDVLSQLQNSFPPSTSLVSIQYRLGDGIDTAVSPACFPVPVHDVSTAFEYLTSPTSPINVDYEEPPKICLLGSNIGGALATMLALTEPNEIHALAVIEPMVDWSGLDDVVEQLRASETSTIPQKRQKQRVTTRYGVENQAVMAAAEELIKMRSKLFQTPSAYFDPFASPMLFLRAPGKDTPLATPVPDQCQLDSYGGYDSLGPATHDSQRSSSSTLTSSSGSPYDTSEPSGVETGTEPSSASTIQPRRRKVLRRWPAVGLPESVTLPYVNIFVHPQTPRNAQQPGSEAEDLGKGHAALMRAQGLEMAELMRRACFMGREKSFAEERVQVYGQGQDQQTTGEVEQDSERRVGKDRVHLHEGTALTKAKLQQGAVDWVAGMFARN